MNMRPLHPFYTQTKQLEMKNTPNTARAMLLAAGLFCFAMFACNRAEPQTGADHQEAVELTETMRLSHKGMEERLDFLKTENKEFKQQVDKLDHPGDSLVQIAAVQDSLIEQFEGMCKEQKKLIDENEDFLKKHERKAMDPAQVAEQHRQIKENYEKLQLQAAAIVHEVEDIKVRIGSADLSENKTK